MSVWSVLALAVPGIAQEAPRYEEQIEVHSFDVQVVVHDHDGNPVPGLLRDDFVVLVNGRRTEITSFAQIRGGRRVDAPETPVDVKAAAAAADGPESVTWAIFLDQRGVRPAIRNAALRQLSDTLDELFLPGDRGILASFSGTGLEIRTPLTEFKPNLLQRLRGIQKERVMIGPVDMRSAAMRAEIERAGEGRAAMQASAEELNSLIEMDSIRTKNAIRALGWFFDILAGLGTRAAVIYLGPGMDSLPVMSLVELWRAKYPQSERDPRAPRPEEKEAALGSELQMLDQRVAASRAPTETAGKQRPKDRIIFGSGSSSRLEAGDTCGRVHR